MGTFSTAKGRKMERTSTSTRKGAPGGRQLQRDGLTASLARRLQQKEDEIYELARLSDKKDNAIKVLLVMKVGGHSRAVRFRFLA